MVPKIDQDRPPDRLFAAIVAARSLRDVEQEVLRPLCLELELKALALALPRRHLLIAWGERRARDRLGLAAQPPAAAGHGDGQAGCHRVLLEAGGACAVFVAQSPSTAEVARRWLLQLALPLAAALRQVLELEEAYRRALTDAGSGLLSRRFFADAMIREIARCRRYGRPGAVLAVRIDGDPMATAGLRLVARSLAGGIRTTDLMARHDESTLLALATETAGEAALRIGWRFVREAGRALGADHACAVGVAAMPPWPLRPEVLVRSALAAADEARARGGRRALLAPPWPRASVTTGAGDR